MFGETAKAHARREREGWFKKYAPAHLAGIDLGCGSDPLNETFRRWDKCLGDGDATHMAGVPDGVFQTVYASHLLEHLGSPTTALQNWYRITRPGGHLIVVVPHRDLYEKRHKLPSAWNRDHRWYFLPDGDDAPTTMHLRGIIVTAVSRANIVSYRVLNDGYNFSLPNNVHPIGEYSIEAIIQKDGP